MATLSARIGSLLEDADQLRAEGKKLRRELNNREGIEAVECLADVPGDLLDAEDSIRKVVRYLNIAVEDAKKGGE